MAGYFSLGENKIRPGAYFNVQKRGDETNFGAIDGVVAATPANQYVTHATLSRY